MSLGYPNMRATHIPIGETGSSAAMPYTACLVEGYEAADIIKYKESYKTVPAGGSARYNVRIDCADYPWCRSHDMVCPGYMYVDEEFIRLGRSYVRAPYCGACGKIRREAKGRHLIDPEHTKGKHGNRLGRMFALIRAWLHSLKGN